MAIKKQGSSIGLQLAIIMSVVILLSLVSVNLIVNYFIRTSEGKTAESNNLTLNLRAAYAVENELNNICSNCFELIDTLSGIAESGDKTLFSKTQNYFFRRNKNIAGIILADGKSTNLKVINNTFFEDSKVDKTVVDAFIKDNGTVIEEVCSGQNRILNISRNFNQPVVALCVPWGENPAQCCIIIFSTDRISTLVSLGVQSINETYIVNHKGDVIISAETPVVLAQENLSENPLVKDLLISKDNNRQIEFTDVDGKKYFGAYKNLDYYKLSVLTTAESDLVYEALDKTLKNNMYLTFSILGLTILIVLLYTHYGISKPLKLLKKAVEGITKGDFSNEYIDYLNTKRKDEIGVLNSGISDEREFLNTFSKFTNQNVATAIATKSIDFEPNPKDITIFFSDIRGFTAISDGFKNRYGNESAAKIIGFLNDYMGRMVECVTLSHGIIDKFEGDAIMAVWGIMRDEDLSYSEEHLKTIREDAVNCITGSIAMRYALMEYNKNAKLTTGDDYKPEIKIGCGINSGRASVGLMGSKDKMEYTSIGDAVNFASRTEASNKACGTDILISEDTYNLIKTDYIRCEENNYELADDKISQEIIVEKIPVAFEVKGKGTQHFYGVVNMPLFDIEAFFKQGNKDFRLDEDCAKACGKNGPSSIAQVRTLLGIPVPDFHKVNLNAEENKINIKQ